MYQALIIVHVLLAAGIIALVLLQQGKGADAGAAFGSGASGTVFGARGSATFLTRATGVLAALFFVTSVGLAKIGDTRQSDGGFMEESAPESIPTDLPSARPESNPASVSDVPQIPTAKDESANVEKKLEQSVSPPITDKTVAPDAQIDHEPESDQIKEPVPAEDLE